MRAFLIIAVPLMCLASEALAGSVVITAGPTATPRTKTWTLADSVFTARILPALKWNYGQVCTTAPADHDSNPATPPQDVTTCADRTNAQAFDALLDSYQAALRDIVQRYERETARATADTTVVPLP